MFDGDHSLADASGYIAQSQTASRGRQTVFSAVMSAVSNTQTREPSRSGVEGFDGPIFLPGSTRGKGTSGRLFFAKIEGETQAYPFSATDTLTLRPSSGSPILQALIDSQFVVDEWLIRRDATHAKSKTFRRMDGLRSARAS